MEVVLGSNCNSGRWGAPLYRSYPAWKPPGLLLVGASGSVVAQTSDTATHGGLRGGDLP